MCVEKNKLFYWKLLFLHKKYNFCPQIIYTVVYLAKAKVYFCSTFFLIEQRIVAKHAKTAAVFIDTTGFSSTKRLLVEIYGEALLVVSAMPCHYRYTLKLQVSDFTQLFCFEVSLCLLTISIVNFLHLFTLLIFKLRTIRLFYVFRSSSVASLSNFLLRDR